MKTGATIVVDDRRFLREAGSSAATLVAALATRRAQSGADLQSPAVRQELFTEAHAVHAASQGGGSGVDIAASVYGGTLCYSLTSVAPVELPPAGRRPAQEGAPRAHAWPRTARNRPGQWKGEKP